MPISITLDSVKCEATSAGKTSDEVYLVYQADAGVPFQLPMRPQPPHSMNTDKDHNTWNIGQTMRFNRDLLITLYDHDTAVTDNRSDYLVSFDYTPSNLPTSTTLSNNDGARYTLNITVNS